LQLLFVCCVKTVQFNKFVTCTQQDGNNQIQVLKEALQQITDGTVSIKYLVVGAVKLIMYFAVWYCFVWCVYSRNELVCL